MGNPGPLRTIRGLGMAYAGTAQGQAPPPHIRDISRCLQVDQAWDHPVSSALEQMLQAFAASSVAARSLCFVCWEARTGVWVTSGLFDRAVLAYG